jgi:hypothetical protein
LNKKPIGRDIQNQVDFDMVYDSIESFMGKVHGMSDSHVLKKYYKNLLDKISKLPKEEAKGYFKNRFGL